MNVLLIGGTGVLSSAVTAEAMKRGISVTMINRGLRQLPEGAEVIISNNKDYQGIAEKIKGRFFDAIIDFLCYNTQELEDSFTLYSRHTKQYFFISSCAVYDTTKGGIYDEDSPKVRKEWPYSVDKWKCELLLADMARNSECAYTVIRPCLTYGDTRLPYGIAPEFRKHWTLIARILAGKPIIRWNHGVNRWNMMRVEEFAVGLVGLIGNPEAYNEAYNICGDEMPSYDDVLEVISKKVNRPILKVDIDSEFYASEMPDRIAGEIIGGRSADLTCSNAKIKKIVPEFSQKVMLAEGVARTIEAYEEQNYQLGIDWTFDAVTDRVVEKWLERKKLPNQYKLIFVDYLHNATIEDRRHYRSIRYSNRTWMRAMMFAGRIIRRLLPESVKKALHKF